MNLSSSSFIRRAARVAAVVFWMAPSCVFATDSIVKTLVKNQGQYFLSGAEIGDKKVDPILPKGKSQDDALLSISSLQNSSIVAHSNLDNSTMTLQLQADKKAVMIVVQEESDRSHYLLGDIDAESGAFRAKPSSVVFFTERSVPQPAEGTNGVTAESETLNEQKEDSDSDSFIFVLVERLQDLGYDVSKSNVFDESLELSELSMKVNGKEELEISIALVLNGKKLTDYKTKYTKMK